MSRRTALGVAPPGWPPLIRLPPRPPSRQQRLRLSDGVGGPDLLQSGDHRPSPESFARVQRRLAQHDALNKHVVHTVSAVFPVPPGVRPGESLGGALFGA